MNYKNYAITFTQPTKNFAFFKLSCLVFFFLTIPLKNNYNSISIILLIVYSLIHYKTFSFKKFLSFKYLYVFYLFVILSLLYTANMEEGLKYLQKNAVFIAFPIVFSIIKLSEKEVKILLKIFVSWVSLLIVYSEVVTVYELMSNNESLYLIFRKDYSYIILASRIDIHPPYIMLIVAFCMIYLALNFGKVFSSKLIDGFIVLLMLFYTTHLSARLSLVSLCFVLFIIYFQGLKKIYNMRTTLLMIILPILFLSFLIYNIRSTRYRFQELIGMQYSSGLYIKSGPSKLDQWKSGLVATDNYLFGEAIGDANNAIILSNKENNLLDNYEHKYNAHNQYIQTYVGLGVLGLILLLYILYYYLYVNPNPFLGKVSKFFLLYLLIVFMSESYLERHHGVVFISFILCFANYKRE